MLTASLPSAPWACASAAQCSSQFATLNFLSLAGLEFSLSTTCQGWGQEGVFSHVLECPAVPRASLDPLLGKDASLCQCTTSPLFSGGQEAAEAPPSILWLTYQHCLPSPSKRLSPPSLWASLPLWTSPRSFCQGKRHCLLVCLNIYIPHRPVAMLLREVIAQATMKIHHENT